ncbi:hypothetical protein DR046_14455 [Jannaschia formosa]|nr:hypothetical protein DR046_14455 [Jannaschia formosa]
MARPWETLPERIHPVAWLILPVSLSTAASAGAVTSNGSTLPAPWATRVAFDTVGSGALFGSRSVRAGPDIIAMIRLSIFVATATLWQAPAIAGVLVSLCPAWIAVAFAPSPSA